MPAPVSNRFKEPMKARMEAIKSLLIGATVVNVDYAEDEQCWPVISVQKDGQRYDLWISMDDEQNGPGTVQIVNQRGKTVNTLCEVSASCLV